MCLAVLLPIQSLRRLRHVLGTTDTALHTSKHLAVSAEFNRIVSVRSSWITPDGRYLTTLVLRKAILCVRTFLTHRVNSDMRTYKSGQLILTQILDFIKRVCLLLLYSNL